ncbi:Putative ankyrin repeat-containing domain superfamily [Colletotrichum destructivum]|uniref:Ankyrin repeat-containing domain superfamily n=1 Tax=Colletotrichum destructivum TaxID=34406 RepID=A0AAX4INY6_9PEZI|nr:Putative ankyrin repeat-containing domain superfamily [Colletotrichum destructivum]
MFAPEHQKLPAPHGALVNYIHDHPEKQMVEILEPYRKYEAQLRSVFAQDRNHPALSDPNINLLPLFTEDTKNIKTRARFLAAETQEERDRYIMALPDDKRRSNGSPAVVSGIKEFQKNFNIFSESSLVDMNWDNVVAAGSSVINTLLPVPPEFNVSKRKLREYYHEKFCPASDVDLFLYGLTHEEAVEKIKEIENSVRDAILNEVTVVRTKYAITIASQYPIRHIQIVLRVYKSVGEILTGFDIDAAGGAYDGKQVWVTPRALGSFITQVNQIDLTRRSPSYENRLSKYSHRNFEVYWPELERNRIDPTIFERSFQRTLGLARLLVLERLPTQSVRDTYLNKRREERGRPTANRFNPHRLNGNIKDSYEDEVADWVDENDVSNYHTFTVPYGQYFHAKKIEKLCYTRDLLLNAEWNQPEQREVYLHRHPAFFGRVEDVIEDCCGCCPKPVTPEEIEIAKKEGEIYISGKVTFMIDDPGRQQIGSFNPLTEDDWTDMAYVGNTARLCQSIVDGDVDEVLDWLSQEGADSNKRDYTGRTPLHLAVISSTPEVVRCLVDHGSRLTARLADGRTALHLAAELGNSDMIKILMDKSITNEEEEDDKADRRRKAVRTRLQEEPASQMTRNQDEYDIDAEGDAKSDEPSDIELVDAGNTEADATSIATGSFVNLKDGNEKSKEDLVLEESTDEPDFYKIDVLAWDVPCSPLHLAISGGHEDAVKVLCDYGSDALLPVKFLDSDKKPTAAILTLSLALSLPIEKAKSMALLLMSLGASSSQADMNGCTAFHRYVENGNQEMIDTLWENDKVGLKTALNHMVFSNNHWSPEAIAPIHTAIENGDSIFVLKLLEAGANPQIEFDTWLKAAKFSKASTSLGSFEDNKTKFNLHTEQPLIVAIQSCPDPQVALNLLEKGADPNTLTTQAHHAIKYERQRYYYNKRQAALDLVQYQLKELRRYKGEDFTQAKPLLPLGMDEFLQGFGKGSYMHWQVSEDIHSLKVNYERQQERYEDAKKKHDELKGVPEKMEAIKDMVESLEKLEKAIIAKGGKTFQELYPDINLSDSRSSKRLSSEEKRSGDYGYVFSFHGVNDVTDVRKAAYLELFEAAWSGDIEKIKSLTLQAWGKNQEEPPLKISVNDSEANTPFSLAYLRGHYDVASAILNIVMAQYSPEDQGATRYKLDTGDSDDRSDETYESDVDSTDEPKIISEIVDKKFTIENIGQVSMQVKSTVKPLEFLTRNIHPFMVEGGRTRSCKGSTQTLFNFVLEHDDHAGLKALLDMAGHFAAQKLVDEVPDEETGGRFPFPEDDFLWAVKHGKTAALGEIIGRTGAGIPLDNLVKKSGLEIKRKSKYYQGLTVYGKKRKDWATAGRNVVVRSTGVKTPPLLHAASAGNIESVEWFLGDAPHRHYVEFGKSRAGRDDGRLKRLSQAPGGFDRAVSKWLGIKNELVLHCAVMGPPTESTNNVIKYLVQACPGSLEYKSTLGDTPLWLAFYFGRLEFAKTLIEAGANQMTRNSSGENIIHAALQGRPKACRLGSVLDLVASSIISHLCQQRNSIHESGTTPLHAWITAVCISRGTSSSYYWGKKYDNNEDILDVLNLLLKFSQGVELEMLNSAGDTPLHTAVMSNDVLLTEALIRHKPKLLYRENAVGRTPAEVARENVTSEKFTAPNPILLKTGNNRNNNKNNPSAIVSRSVESFIKNDDDDDNGNLKCSVRLSNKQKVWEGMRGILEQHPDKRRLVSLNEANDVAKRLGEKYNASRYFSITVRQDEDADSEEDETGYKYKDGFASKPRMRQRQRACMNVPQGQGQERVSWLQQETGLQVRAVSWE